MPLRKPVSMLTVESDILIILATIWKVVLFKNSSRSQVSETNEHWSIAILSHPNLSKLLT